MRLEHWVVLAYLAACIGIGVLMSRKVLTSRDEYWVAGRRIGTWVNALAIMAALASGGSIIGVMGLAYGRGIPYTLALFAGAVVGFPLASILVARPLRNFGRFTITDFLAWRFPHPLVRWLVPVVIVVSFTVYIVAQLKAAGITAEVLLGIPYREAVTVSTLVFIAYVSLGGMLAITWTDVIQGALMLCVVLGTALLLPGTASHGAVFAEATRLAPELGEVTQHPVMSYLGIFVLWAAAIPVIPHVVMRVYTARDVRGARLSLNLAMVLYSVMILVAVLVVVPRGRLDFPGLTDPDTVFLRVMEGGFSPLIRGLAVAAVIAAVMSTTDALLLACSSAIAHDLLGRWIERRLSPRAGGWITVAVAWAIGLLAMVLAWSPPRLISEFYSAAIGMLSSGLLVPTLAGLWWKGARRAGGAASLVTGLAVYLAVQLTPGAPPFSAVLFALPASAVAMVLVSRRAESSADPALSEVAALHEERI
jgi:sodium/pantothenate symporter